MRHWLVLQNLIQMKELVDWLRSQQKANDIYYLGKTEVVEPELKEEVTQRIELRDNLLAKVKQKLFDDTDHAVLTENLAWMLEFHRKGIDCYIFNTSVSRESREQAF